MFLPHLVDAVSQKFSRFICILISLGVVVAIMLGLQEKIEEQSGYAIFDSPFNALTQTDLANALLQYDPQSLINLWLFYGLDFIFPFLSSLLTASLAAWGIRQIWPSLYETKKLHPWFYLFFLSTLLDWFENIAFLVTLVNSPPANESLMSTYFLVHNAKSWGAPVGAIAFLLFLYGGILFLRNKMVAES